VNSSQQDIEQRVRLAGSNMFELLLFRLGEPVETQSAKEQVQPDELFGINVFKVREILAMPEITSIAGAGPNILGVVDIRGQVIPVLDLARIVGFRPKQAPKILLVTEFARTTQGFAVEEVDDIVRLEWNQVLSAESHSGGRTVTSFARIDGNIDGSRLAQVLDVERIVRDVLPSTKDNEITEASTGRIVIKPGAKVLAADDSGVARALIEQSLIAMGLPYVMTKTGQEAWNVLEATAKRARKEGTEVADHIALVLTDLEMPEMDGFTLTRRIKADASLQHIPVVIHSSLSGAANEQHVRKVGANAYVSKFEPSELAEVMRGALGRAA
jgi:two-component system, chemotaxis family, chemotaxis protein CheV